MRPKNPFPIGQAIESAAGLPGEAYISQRILDLENERVLGRTWVCIALEDDVPTPGDVHPVHAAGQPLLVVRDQQGALRVFHNVCRHRGSLLVDRPQSGLRRIACPYHAWTYDLTGALTATPCFNGLGQEGHAAADPQVAERSLLEVRSATWNRLVFVNLSGDAPALEDWLAPLMARWQAYDFSLIRHGGGIKFEIAANWKLVLDNFLESYHLPWVHRGLNSYSPLDDHELVVEDLFMGQLSLNYQPQDDAAARLPVFPGLSPDQMRRAEYLLVFPNLMLSCTRDHFRVTILNATAPDHTTQRWEFFFVGEASLDDSLANARRSLLDRIAAVNGEDLSILERLQAGRTSRGFDGGCFSPFHERTLHNFHRLISERLAE